MTEHKIENLQELISQYVGPEKHIVDTQIKSLTAPGENYFSIMLEVNLKLKNEKTNKEEHLHAVAKCMLPPNNAMPGPADFTYVSEVAFYDEIIPVIENFCKEEGAMSIKDMFPELYGFRRNLHGQNEKVDENAVIMLENLKVKGFSNIDRSIGFDLEGAKVVLKDLAYFHSTFLALKLKKPDVFKKKILGNIRGPPGPPEHASQRDLATHGPPPNGPPPHGPPPHRPPLHGSPSNGLPPHDPSSHGPPHHGPPHHGPPPHDGHPDGGPGLPYVIFDILEENDNLKKYIPRVKTIKFSPPFGGTLEDNPDKPFLTFVHNDMWVNNTMQKFKNGKISENKFVDFQMYSFDSPVRDVIFFIWSSIQVEVIKQHFNYLLKFYHEIFLNNLKDLDCNITPFSFEKFMDEVKLHAPNELSHVLMMCMVIFGKKGVALVDTSAGPPRLDAFKLEDMTDETKARVVESVKFYADKGWI